MKSLLGKLGVILIVGLAIFGYEEVRGAECAWVLWMKSNVEVFSGNEYFNDFLPRLKDWIILDAFPSHKQGQKAQKDSIESEREKPKILCLTFVFRGLSF